MILSNVEVQNAMDLGRLEINPKPMPLRPSIGSHCPYDTHAVDLTLGTEISVPEGGPFTIDFSQPGRIAEFIAKHCRKMTISTEQPYALKVSRFVLARTHESVSLPILSGYPTCLAARIEGKSSRARCGLLVHFTAPTVHPGWNGPLTLEMINLGPAELLLRPGIAIAQLIVEEVSGRPFENPSQFLKQVTPEGT